MKMKLKSFIYLVLGLALFIGIASPMAAVAAYSGPFDAACAGNGSATVCQDSSKPHDTSNNAIYGPDGIITKAARLLSLLIGVVAVVMVMIAGFKFITSQGDANQVASARNTIIYAVVGLVVAALAQAIIIFVLDKVK